MLSLKNIKHRTQEGFTLLEVLLVVAIIAILAGIVIIAINPGKNLGDTRNSQRSADVNTIINGVYQYALDNNGVLPAVGARTGAVVIPTAPTAAAEICNTTTSTCTGLVDLAVLTTNGKYVVSIPKDPQAPNGCSSGCGANGTGYSIQKDANGRLIVNAMSPEQGKTISVTK
ncbi:MAG TPA: type II secretion system protein [Bacillota bacterium]|nr:type II secretion system protein [Bacillota bacterium]